MKTIHSGYLMMFVYTVLMLGKINSVEVSQRSKVEI